MSMRSADASGGAAPLEEGLLPHLCDTCRLEFPCRRCLSSLCVSQLPAADAFGFSPSSSSGFPCTLPADIGGNADAGFGLPPDGFKQVPQLGDVWSRLHLILLQLQALHRLRWVRGFHDSIRSVLLSSGSVFDLALLYQYVSM